ncbi:MAG: hypothetical protein WDN67_04610 [Candidatus Moraniibacteriota bacterium]
MTNDAARPLFRGTQFIWYALTLIEALLVLRFLLRLLQANPGAGFTNFIYSLSGIFTAPFEAVFRNVYVQGSVFEWTTLLAMLVYYLIAYGNRPSLGDGQAGLERRSKRASRCPRRLGTLLK